MTKLKNMVVIGNYGIDGKLNGQTARTRTVFESLEKKYNNVYNIKKIDTSSKNIFNYIICLIFIFRANKIVIMPAKGSLKYINVLINLTKQHKNTYYVVIGGWLYEYIKDNSNLIKSIKKYNSLYVQVNDLKNNLESIGIKNVYLFPNYRINTREYDFDGLEYNDKIVYYSRIREDKGAGYIIDFINKYNVKNHKNIKLDFYGPIDEDYLESFLKKITNNDFCSYKGILNGDDIVITLSKYMFMIFPTYYEGEGFPGAILESFMSGLPVIATDWKYNKDLIKEGYTGYIFNVRNYEQFERKINLMLNDDNYLKLKKYALKESKNYTEARIFKILSDRIDVEV